MKQKQFQFALWFILFCGCLGVFFGCNRVSEATDRNASEACIAVTGEQNGMNNGAFGDLSVAYDDKIYYVGDSGGNERLYVSDLDGNQEQELFEAPWLNDIFGLHTDGTFLYFVQSVSMEADEGEESIWRMDLRDGSCEQIYKVNQKVITSLELYDKLYFLESSFSEELEKSYLKTIDIDGGKAKKLGQLKTDRIMIYDGKIYPAGNGKGKSLVRYSLEGKHKETLYTAKDGYAKFLQILNERILFEVGSSSGVPEFYTMDMDGNDVREIALNASNDNVTTNSIDGKLYVLEAYEVPVVTNSDLAIEPSSPSSATASDLKKESNNVQPTDECFTKELYNIHILSYDGNGNSELLQSFQNVPPTVGSFSGKWVVYYWVNMDDYMQIYHKDLRDEIS